MKPIFKITPVERGGDLQAIVASLAERGIITSHPAGGSTTFFVFTVEGGDEASIDHAQKKVMPLFGRILSDDKVTAAEGAELASLLFPHVRPVYVELVEAIQEAIDSLKDDGRISIMEALKIASHFRVEHF